MAILENFIFVPNQTFCGRLEVSVVYWWRILFDIRILRIKLPLREGNLTISAFSRGRKILSKVRGGPETAMRAHPGSTPGVAQNFLQLLLKRKYAAQDAEMIDW